MHKIHILHHVTYTISEFNHTFIKSKKKENLMGLRNSLYPLYPYLRFFNKTLKAPSMDVLL